ncbi:hypothetical protein ACQ5SO_01315 [Rhodovulum sp. DZ06]|uniref:hypothetical protein n=1 Tax=Rhodovulum sp. DZ06 TaxID=3425126 RepID=UPI003D349D87
METIDSYCERLGPGFWAEPLNALSNLSFIICALVAWRIARRAGRSGDYAVRALVGTELVIGVGSFLFHTFATRWAAAADVIPILVFILFYIHFATTRFFGAPAWGGLVAVAAFFPTAAGLGAAIRAVLGPLNGSAGYGAVLLVIVGYGAAALKTARSAVGRDLLIGAGMLFVSLVFRTLDDQHGPVCAALPIGTHWAWHLLNGVMLAWMTVIIVRHGALKRAD